MSEAYKSGKIKDGDLILMAAFGSGFTGCFVDEMVKNG